MSQTAIQRPIVQGVVSEPTSATPSDRDENNEDEEPPEDTGRPTGKDEDVFGEKFEIPAFLRKIR
jgi:hypothetical protein